MLSVSNDYKTALTQPKTINAKIIIGANTITSDDINQIKRSFNSGLFNTIAKMVEIDTNTSIAKGTTIEPQFGVYIDNAFEYASLGEYKTKDEPVLKKDTNSYEIIAYDKIVESMVAYELTDVDITYPCTVRDLIVAIFTKLGWSTSGIPNSFTNSTSQIEQDVYSNMNMTYRDVLDELCTISCMFLIDDNGTPTLTTGTTTNGTINEGYFKDTNVDIKEQVIFNSLVFSRAGGSDNIVRKDDASITTNGLHEFKVSDLQILSMNWRDNFIDGMWNYIKDFTYYAFDTNTVGITFLEPVDKFTISIFNNTYSTILLNSDLTICDGVNEKIYSNVPKQTETEYKYATDTDKKINQTNLIVDKQNGQISSLVSTVGEIEESVETIQTNTYTKTEIQRIADGTGVDGVKVTSVESISGTFDLDGMHYEKLNAPTKSTINEKGVDVKKTVDNTVLLFAGFDEDLGQSVVSAENLRTRQYLNIGNNSRIEDYETGGGIFIL